MIIQYCILAIIILIALYGIHIMPRIFNKQDLSLFQGRYYAHRGLHNNNNLDCPENSLRAFALAVDSGYGIELDVQLTKDEEPVVIHDYNLLRICGIDKKVNECTYNELTAYRLYNSTQGIPHLKEVLDLVAGRVPLIIELKVRQKVDRTCTITQGLLKDYKGVYCVESFNPYVLIWYRKNIPDIIRGQLSTNYYKDKEEGNMFNFFILKHMLLNIYTRPDFIAYNHTHHRDLSFLLVTKLYKAPAFAWTIKDQIELDKSRKYFDYFIFDSFIPR